MRHLLNLKYKKISWS